jgi:alpha-beta hydrolase superfamily lysophospholipase
VATTDASRAVPVETTLSTPRRERPMSDQTLTIVLVHGAFAESASWNPVIDRLQAHGLDVVAAANPLRSVDGDAAYEPDTVTATILAAVAAA